MRLLALLSLTATLFGQKPALTAELRGGAAEEKKIAQSETLNYSINWPSGLSLGEGQLSSTRTKSADGEHWEFGLNLEAAVPGFPLQETISSKANAGYCSTELDKNSIRGKKTSKETTTFDSVKMTATRTTLNGGGKSEMSLPACAKDALAYIFFLRRELAQGRLPILQKVYYGSPYDTRVQFMGAQTIRVGDSQVDTDRILATIKGPASEVTVELFFARDPVRTPVLIKVPLAMGKFSMEIIR
ncbi:MAG: DUF3108 domain-containing protein [Bryobacteraceae bacterium]